MESQKALQRKGIIYAAGAYTMWGILPVYWKWVEEVPAEEILAHRIVWAFVFMLIVLGVSKRFGQFMSELMKLFTQPKLFISLTIASILITGNWFVYIWAVNHGHIIEASLGYYINPLVSIVLGTVVLKEKLNFWQYVAVGLAGVGVVILTVRYGEIPWIALSLACTFGLYGLTKKLLNYDAMNGLTLETMIVTPVAAIYLFMVGAHGFGSFGSISIAETLLLMGAGAVTALPLFYFAKGAQRIPLYMIGFLQYIAPTINLILGIFIFHEHFTSAHSMAFLFIWIALFIFSIAKTKFLLKKQPKFLKNKSAKYYNA
ncbi:MULTISPECIES: EamA family transporter RarD [Bacillus cereus group]|uniref:Possible chloramphenicol-sensitive RarD protein n=1 Tax=Bacillus cytotoxicus TaxID=580165 RepID=A0AAX2CI94_9BACI|nr:MULTISPECIES: EamA family transporter RarD [Bacillus cereus group]QTR78416.1 EamA family transporter RarD [Bacillus cytotoxicus]QTR81777.1 EamA family transporter RarD [Bacillus cytotoxicus]QTR85513.1 EamA family transporter RarD [Bacillus cytotoxicus]SCL95434.1 Possible chloramphenicol-sensitive RarD protein [Bacillus cytotoxicus]HDR4572973.1 EamA family transporter RarD [Bacillus cytotoxicus]